MMVKRTNTDTKTIEVVTYLLQNYPRVQELSAPRMMWILYLIDWKSSIDLNRQLTNIEWRNDDSGPASEVRILNFINNNRRHFEINTFNNKYSGRRENFWFSSKDSDSSLSEEETGIIQFIIDHTYALSWRELSSLIHSTPPVRESSVASRLNLVHYAKEMKRGW